MLSSRRVFCVNQHHAQQNTGVISFVEWLQFCVPGPGRDKDSFNCAGRHGLRSYSTAIDGVACNWCEGLYPVGSKMFACRECDCDACLECAIAHLQFCTTRISCERVGSSSCSLCPAPEEEEEEAQEEG